MEHQEVTALSSEAPDNAPLQVGAVLDGKYELTARLGTGGMGTVYRARHLEMGNDVAIKILHPRYAANPEGVKRFQREARIISALRHRNIVAVYAMGAVNGLIYMVTELVEGDSLGEWLSSTGRIPVAQAVPLFIQICDAMIHAHQNDIFHRDLKPDNVIVVIENDLSRIAKVIDFGLAKLLDGDDGQRLTKTGEVLGDPNYMSPEQAQGQQLDARSDIYSFGCLMYEVLSGKQPFAADTAVAILMKQVTENPAPFAQSCNVPQALEAITLTAMAKDREQRYESFEALKDVLTKFTADPNIKLKAPQARRGSVQVPGQLKLANHKLFLFIASAVILCGIASYISWSSNQMAYEQARLVEQEELQTFVSDTTFPAWVGKYSEEQLTRLAATAKRVGNKVAYGRAQNGLFDIYLVERRKSEAIDAARKALSEGKLSEYADFYILLAAFQTACEDRQLQAAEALYSKLCFSKSFYAARYLDDNSVRLADLEAEMGNRQKAEELCGVILPHHFAKLDHSSAPLEIAARCNLIHSYLKRGNEEVAKRLMASFEDSGSILHDKGLDPLALPKLHLLVEQKKYSDVERLKRQVLASSLPEKVKASVLMSISYWYCLRGDYDRAKNEQADLARLAAHGKNVFANGEISDYEVVARMEMNRMKKDYQSVAQDGERLVNRMLSRRDTAALLNLTADLYIEAMQHLGRTAEIKQLNARMGKHFKAIYDRAWRGSDRRGRDWRWRFRDRSMFDDF